MFKKLRLFFAYLLIAFLPLQGLAAANMSVCSSSMQNESTKQKAAMPHCNMRMADVAQGTKNSPQQQHDCCKAYCAALCASFVSVTTLPSSLGLIHSLAMSQKLMLIVPLYASITQANLQRPPIFLS